MTVGEKIQFYRKKIGLSQEELGQKMFVSRQTVSLWEMDKTLPTIDNLLRLKEIFSISLDEILSDSQPITQEKEQFEEGYVFTYSQAELNKILKRFNLQLLKRFAIFMVCFIVLTVFCALADAPDSVFGILIGVFLIGVISYIRAYFSSKKGWKAHEDRIIESKYDYRINREYFLLNIYRNEESVREYKIYLKDVEKIEDFGSFLVLQFSGQRHLIKKDIIKPDSIFYSLSTKAVKKVDSNKPKIFLNILSKVLLVLSIASIIGAMISVAIVTNNNNMLTENTWLFFLFTPIPFASIFFGLYLKKRGYSFKNNLFVGIGVLAFLCVYGSFSFVFYSIYSHSDEPILKAEQTLSIDIPEHFHINTESWESGEHSAPRGYILSTSDIYFKQEAVAEFEEAIKSDGRWLASIPNDLIGITSYFSDYTIFDYCIIYNVQASEFNQLPSESGAYKFLNVFYDTNTNTMKIVEYEIEYKK